MAFISSDSFLKVNSKNTSDDSMVLFLCLYICHNSLSLRKNCSSEISNISLWGDLLLYLLPAAVCLFSEFAGNVNWWLQFHASFSLVEKFQLFLSFWTIIDIIFIILDIFLLIDVTFGIHLAINTVNSLVKKMDTCQTKISQSRQIACPWRSPPVPPT